MRNIGASQFNYEVFKAAYDSDTKLQELVSDFDENNITLSDGSAELEPGAAEVGSGGDSVSSMARRATDLGDKL